MPFKQEKILCQKDYTFLLQYHFVNYKKIGALHDITSKKYIEGKAFYHINAK